MNGKFKRGEEGTTNFDVVYGRGRKDNKQTEDMSSPQSTGWSSAIDLSCVRDYLTLVWLWRPVQVLMIFRSLFSICLDRGRIVRPNLGNCVVSEIAFHSSKPFNCRYSWLKLHITFDLVFYRRKLLIQDYEEVQFGKKIKANEIIEK